MTREAMENRLVNYTAEDGIAIVELNDPPANTYTYEMMRDFDDAILEARLDEDVHVIVVRGAGDKFFCAGANIKMLLSATPQFRYFFSLHGNETLMRLENTAKLVIAAINGHALVRLVTHEASPGPLRGLRFRFCHKLSGSVL